MSVFQQVFSRGDAFIAYITAGHRGLSFTEQAALALVKGGVDILEIGVPFSDPIADGPIIQQAMNSALASSVNMRSIFNTVSQIKQRTSTPVVLFTYLNPLLAMGLDKAFEGASLAGVDGILVVDLPIEESALYFAKCLFYGLEPISLLSPTTEKNRIKIISQHGDSFLYYVCRNGITGTKNTLPDDYVKNLTSIKQMTDKPVVSGFGIASRDLAAQALKHADGFVVGSAFVEAISNGASPSDLKNLALQLDPR